MKPDPSTPKQAVSWETFSNLLENGMEPYRKEKLPGRNDKCPCGSGKKAKKCCLAKLQAFAVLPPQLRELVVVAKILGHPLNTPRA